MIQRTVPFSQKKKGKVSPIYPLGVDCVGVTGKEVVERGSWVSALSSPFNKDLGAFKLKVGVKVIFPSVHSGHLENGT